MKFAKDILMLDFEGVKSPLQIGAVLLDKETLIEKDYFTSYIYAEAEDILTKSGITANMVKAAPEQSEVGKTLIDKFGKDYFIGSWVANLDMRHFRKIVCSAGYDWCDFDFHVIDVWPIAYLHLLKTGYKGGVGSEEIFQAFGAKPRGLHNALEDARLASAVLRKLAFD